MLKSSARSMIRLRGVRHNNLKNFDLDLPLKKLIVITGLSGSGKSSLAFDTLFAEGQRRYIETFSPYARQFFDRMDKPQVDSIEAIPPAIAIEQRNAVRTTRSTVGTMTEICDYMKMLWPHIAQLHCRQCGEPVRKDSPKDIWNSASRQNGSPEFLITFDLPLTEKLSLAESLALIAKQGYQRLLIEGEVVRIEEAVSRFTIHDSRSTSLTIIQDRLRLTESNRPRFIEACEQAYHFGKGKLALREVSASFPALDPRPFSNRLHCAQCDIEYQEPSPALFSFNNPVGACPSCRGFGRNISIDYDRALPDQSKTLAGGVVKPWQTGHGLESQNDLMRMCRHFEIPTDVPFEKLKKKWQEFVIEGEPDYGKDEEHEWPRAWYGVKGYFRWLESKAYKMHVRVLLSRYRAYTTCPECDGNRFQPETLLYQVPLLAPNGKKSGLEFAGQSSKTGDEPRKSSTCRVESADLHQCAFLTLADFYRLPIRDAARFIESLAQDRPPQQRDPLELILNEVSSRLGYLNEVGLGYLTLDRPTRSLSGGETERVNLTTCLGTRLVNTLFVLDEPSVGLHPRDTERLISIVKRLRDAGNTVVVVEHEASIMRAADQIVDLGPGHGAMGGEVVFQGTYRRILRAKDSVTGQYLSGRKRLEIPQRRSVNTGRALRTPLLLRTRDTNHQALIVNDAPYRRGHIENDDSALRLEHATKHNLTDVSVEIPLRRFVCITGVSGSGKTTLVREVLLPALQSKLKDVPLDTKASDRLTREEGEGDNGTVPSAAGYHSTGLEGWESIGRVILVDQSILGKTPRSNPAVYIGAFDDIRELFAQSEAARQRGLSASAFSFNSAQGQCERCRGAGFEKIEMQFLSDVFIRCPDCNGRRYRKHILEVKLSTPGVEGRGTRRKKPRLGKRRDLITRHLSGTKSIADLLDSTVEEAIAFLSDFPESRPAQRAAESLGLLKEVGLGYLKLGQPINTLSGGESQRLKLVRYLAESDVGAGKVASKHLGSRETVKYSNAGISPPVSILFLFDEPTTGLHFDDVGVLLRVFQRLVDAGHSVMVIEHNLDVIKSADWVIDLGPEAGDQGGRIVAEGTPEEVAACSESHTGKALRDLLKVAQRQGEKKQNTNLKYQITSKF